MAHTRTLRTTATLLLALAALTAGCSTHNKGITGTPPSVTASASASPTPSLDPSVAAASQAAIAAYTGYFRAYAAASSTGNPDDPDLAKYAADPLLSLTRHNIRVDFLEAGKVQVGTPKATATLTKADLRGKPPTITLTVCLDYRGLSLAYKSNHSPVPNSTLTSKPFAGTAVVTSYPDGRWLVTQATSHRESPC